MVFQRRGKWCVKDERGLRKFNTKEEANKYAGVEEAPTQQEMDFEDVDLQEEKLVDGTVPGETLQDLIFRRSHGTTRDA